MQPATPGQAFLLSYLCGILWYAGTCYWIYDTMRHFGGLKVVVPTGTFKTTAELFGKAFYNIATELSEAEVCH